MFDFDNIFTHKVSYKSRDIASQAKRLVLNEKHKISRILYCGPNYSDIAGGIVLFRISELKFGENYLEKITFKAEQKSIDTHYMRVAHPEFHRELKDPHKEEYKRDYQNNDMNLSAVCHYRPSEETKNYILSSEIINDSRAFKSKMNVISDFYTYWKLRSYYRK